MSFPERLHVAFAVCHPECGATEFVVDGSTRVVRTDAEIETKVRTALGIDGEAPQPRPPEPDLVPAEAKAA